MIDKNKSTKFIAKAALNQCRGGERLWLAGLLASDTEQDVMPVGSEIHSQNGANAGYVTSAASPIKYPRALVFAHLDTSCPPGDTLTFRGVSGWSVCSLPVN